MAKTATQCINFYFINVAKFAVSVLGGGQNLERRNVKRLIFRNFEITNIKMKKDELFDLFIFELFLNIF